MRLYLPNDTQWLSTGILRADQDIDQFFDRWRRRRQDITESAGQCLCRRDVGYSGRYGRVALLLGQDEVTKLFAFSTSGNAASLQERD